MVAIGLVVAVFLALQWPTRGAGQSFFSHTLFRALLFLWNIFFIQNTSPFFLPISLPTCTLNKHEDSVFFACLVQFFEQGNKIWKGLLGTPQSSNRIISKSAATMFLNSRILPNWGPSGDGKEISSLPLPSPLHPELAGDGI